MLIQTTYLPLSESQSEYFKDSKVVDDQGRLKVMYHGTSSAGFTVFDGDKGISSSSFFFSADESVAASYSGTYDEVKYIKHFNALKKSIENVDKRYSVVKEGNEYVVCDDEEEIVRSSDRQDAYNEWNNYSGYGGEVGL